MANKLFLAIICLTLCFLPGAYTQDTGGEIVCKVIRADSGAPVFYSTVKLFGTNRGTIADDKGQFRLPGSLNSSQKIILSSIGYEIKEVYISDLKPNTLNLIYLQPSIDKLATVVLRSKKKKRRLSAKRIVKKAIASIKENYSQTPFSYIAYYRDYQQPIDSSYVLNTDQEIYPEYINLNESILHVFDAGFDTDHLDNDDNQTVLYSYLRNEDFVRDSLFTVPYDNYKKKYLKDVVIPPLGGNELNLLTLTDAVRNYNKRSFSFVESLKLDFVKNHRFKLNKVNYLDDIALYEIDFYSYKDITKSTYRGKGKIYISKEDYAIHKLSYGLYGSKNEFPLYAVNIEYKKNGEKMYLNYITFNNRFEIYGDPSFAIEEIIYNVNNSSFDVVFNKDFDRLSIKTSRKKIKLSYEEQKIDIEDVLLFSRHIRIKVNKKQMQKIPNLNAEGLSKNIKLLMKGITDTKGNVLNEAPKLALNQYREIFVQEVFTESRLEPRFKVVDKQAPLSASEINEFNNKHLYWINTPLKKNKKH